MGAIDFTNIEYWTQVRVGQIGSGSCFSVKSIYQCRVCFGLELRNFQGDLAIQLRVVSSIDGTHPTTTQKSFDLVPTQTRRRLAAGEVLASFAMVGWGLSERCTRNRASRFGGVLRLLRGWGLHGVLGWFWHAGAFGLVGVSVQRNLQGWFIKAARHVFLYALVRFSSRNRRLLGALRLRLVAIRVG